MYCYIISLEIGIYICFLEREANRENISLNLLQCLATSIMLALHLITLGAIRLLD